MPAEEPTPDAAFEQLAGKYADEVTAFSPVWATWLGDHRFDDRVDDVTAAARRRKADFCRDCLEQLGRIDAGKLSRDNRIDAAMLAHSLRSEVWHVEELAEWRWNPMVYTRAAGNAVYSLMAREFAPLRRRLISAASRLEQLPRLLADAREVLDPPRVPQVHAATAVKQNPGVISIIDEMIAPRAEALGPGDRSRLAGAMDAARSAVRIHQKWLEEVLLPRAGGDFRLGPDLYDEKLAFVLHSPLERAEIRRRAEAELARTIDEMYEIAAGFPGSRQPGETPPASPDAAHKRRVIRGALAAAYRDTLEPDELVPAARESLDKAAAFVRSAGLVTLSEEPVEVIVMPEFRRGPALAYCDSPGPLDAARRTYYAIAPPPADWTAEQVRSLLREYNRRSLQNLTVHEAMPGHFLQLTLANRHPSALRAMLASGVFVEGWAVYAERLMVDQGFGEGDPLMRLIVLKWYLRCIANALLDQAVHTGGMTQRGAMALMMDRTFQAEREAAGKWTRAQLTSGQLSTYFVGYQEHAALRRDVQRARGERFDLRAYHDALLSLGSVPPRYARALMLDMPVPPDAA